MKNEQNPNYDMLEIMSEEEIDNNFNEIIKSCNELLAAKCTCSKPWDYCI